jgi:hypothetical protein
LPAIWMISEPRLRLLPPRAGWRFSCFFKIIPIIGSAIAGLRDATSACCYGFCGPCDIYIYIFYSVISGFFMFRLLDFSNPPFRCVYRCKDFSCLFF